MTAPGCLIVARKGSKRLPGKNTMDFMGEPLFMRVVRTVRESGLFRRILFSTDDELIIETLKGTEDVEVHERSPELAGDDATVMQVLDDLLQNGHPAFTEVEDCFILTPCAPLLTQTHLHSAWNRYIQSEATSLCSVTEFPFPPSLTLSLGEGGVVSRNWTGATRKADHPVKYYPNGAMLIVNLDVFKYRGQFFTDDTIGFIMPSYESVDIDYPKDLKLARRLAEIQLDGTAEK